MIRKTTLAIGVFLLLLNFINAQEALPKGAKLKTVDFKTTDYIAIGYVEKDIFVENQILTFFTKETQDTIISGKYYSKDGNAYINGIWKQNTDNGTTRAKGIFKISNTGGVGLTLKSKESKNLSIIADIVFYYQGFANKNPATLEKQKNGDILCVIQYLDRKNLSKLEFLVSKTLIDKYGFFAIDDFAFYTTDVKMIYKDGQIFNGIVENTKDADNDILFNMKVGKWKTANSEEEEIAWLPNGDYKYRRVYLKEKDKNNIVEVELIITPTQMEKWGYWNSTEYFKNISQVKYTYKNGNIYEGKIDLEKQLLTNGTYKYSTGEVFEGNLGGSWYCGIPIDGKMKFTGGTIENSNWLKKYYLTLVEVEKLEKINSPTDIRNKAIEYFNVRQKEKEKHELIEKVKKASENYNYFTEDEMEGLHKQLSELIAESKKEKNSENEIFMIDK